MSALHDSTTARGRFARVLGPGRPGDGAWAAEVAPPEARPRGRLRPWLSALSFQKPPREEEEEAVPVAHRSQGRIPARVPEQAGGAPALGPLGQHLSRGEPGLQPGALQVSGLARALRPTPSRPVPRAPGSRGWTPRGSGAGPAGKQEMPRHSTMCQQPPSKLHFPRLPSLWRPFVLTGRLGRAWALGSTAAGP